MIQGGMYQQRYQKQLYQHRQAAVLEAAVLMQTGMCQQLSQKQLYQHRQACFSSWIRSSCTNNSFKTTASQCTVPMYLLWLKMVNCGHFPQWYSAQATDLLLTVRLTLANFDSAYRHKSRQHLTSIFVVKLLLANPNIFLITSLSCGCWLFY